MNTPTKRSAAVLSVTLLAFGCLAPAASADDAGQKSLVERYSTLSGALISAQAQRQQLTVSQYLKNTQATVYTMPASDGMSAVSVLASQNPAKGMGMRLQASSLSDLNQQLAANKVAFSSSDYSSMEALANAMREKSGSADAQVTAAGAKWVGQLSGLTTGQLTAPTEQKVAAPAVTAESLGFGLFLDKSITQLATSRPDIISSVQATGLGSKSGQKAWAGAMSTAWAQSGQDITAALPSPCTGGMLAVMATGDASSAAKYGSCGTGCVAGGMYLHSQALDLFNGGSSAVTDPGLNTAGAITPLTVLQDLPGGAQTGALGSIANTTPDLNQMLSGNGTACSTASANTTNVLKQTLPGVWGGLALK